MNREIPVVSEELMKQVYRIFYHGGQRAKSHDLRFGQYLLNQIAHKYKCKSRADATRILFNLENPEILELIKDYNE